MDQMIISNISRSSISGTYEGNQIVVSGEAYLPGYGSPGFVAYASTLVAKDVDGQTLVLSEADRRDILNALVRAMSLEGNSLEVEA